MSAFQTVLLPELTPEEIKQWNHADARMVEHLSINFTREIRRVLAITEPLNDNTCGKLHFVGDYLDVILNVRQWNRDIADSAMRELWGNRRIIYFVFDPMTGYFAPTKFCAFTIIGLSNIATNTVESGMSIQRYCEIDQHGIFDGNKAWHHLAHNLAMRKLHSGDDPLLDAHFDRWYQQCNGVVNVHPDGPIFLIPPPWFLP